MPPPVKASEPFLFYTRLNLSELTGLRASTLPELLAHIKSVPESCIYHHTHRFLRQHQYLSPEPPNDFAYWVSAVLGEDILAEKLASIDIVQFFTINDLRNKIIRVIEEYIKSEPESAQRRAHENEEFHFIKAISFILPTADSASDLAEFVEILKKVAVDSIYFHIFEARLRLGKKTNDFSYWMETSAGEKGIADKILRLDPYTYTLEDLRQAIIKIVEKGTR